MRTKAAGGVSAATGEPGAGPQGRTGARKAHAERPPHGARQCTKMLLCSILRAHIPQPQKGSSCRLYYHFAVIGVNYAEHLHLTAGFCIYINFIFHILILEIYFIFSVIKFYFIVMYL
mgnify:CR=1 FL=1